MRKIRLEPGTKLFLLGIGGAGMRGLAQLLAGQGIVVSGTDRRWQEIKREADLQPYTLAAEEKAGNLLRVAEALVYSDAVPVDHPLRQTAHELGLPEMAYQEALGRLSEKYQTIAVAGTHGKSSTTAMLAHILLAAGREPSVLIGAHGSLVPTLDGRNARVGKSDLLVVEADEYREHFLKLQPAAAIITTIDWDHPDFFPSLSQVAAAFGRFLQRIKAGGAVVVGEKTYLAWEKLPWPQNTKVVKTATAEKRQLVLPGEHMQHNAALAVAMAEQLGVSTGAAAKYLKSFAGLGRRFEKLGEYQKMIVISDYGHHPAEIKATLEGARVFYGQKKIAAILEAHTLARLKTFLPAYQEALRLADSAVLAPVFVPLGREVETQEAEQWLEKLRRELVQNNRQAEVFTDYGSLPAVLKRLALKYEVVIAFSAGRLDGELRRIVG